MPVSGVDITRDGQIATIILKPVTEMIELGMQGTEIVETSVAVALALEQLRYDDSIRIVVITGRDDGEFYVVPPSEFFKTAAMRERLARSTAHGRSMAWSRQGIERTMESLLLIDKPVIARVNGDATGYGQSIIFGCDMIVARDDAAITDVHLSGGSYLDPSGVPRGASFSLTPGDGVISFLPHFLPPTKAKEYLFLGRSCTTKQLAEMNIVNFAVPLEDLDAQLSEITSELLERDARSIARTKRLYNKALVGQWNLALDLASSFEKLDIYEHSSGGFADGVSLSAVSDE